VLYCYILFWHLSRGTEDNNEDRSLKTRYPIRDSNLGPSGEDEGAVTFQSEVWLDWNCVRFTFALLPFKNIVRRQLHCEVRSI